MTLSILYTVHGFVSLWCWQSTDATQLGSRLWPSTLVLLASLLVFPKGREALKSFLLFPKPKEFLLAIGLAIFCFMLAAGAFYFSKGSSPILGSAFLFGSANASTLFAMLLFFALSEVIFRKLLMPEWGSSNVALLEALTLGVATLSFSLSIGVWAWGYILGRVQAAPSSSALLIGRILWHFALFSLVFIG